MPEVHKNYLVKEQCIGSFIINFIINGIIGWAIYRKMAVVPFAAPFGENSISGDIVGISLLLPLIVAWIIGAVTHKKMKDGALPHLPWGLVSKGYGKLPRSTFLRALIIGIVLMIVTSVLAIAGFKVLGIAEMSLWPFVIWHGLLAGILAAITAPVAALYALGDDGFAPPAK